MLMSIGFIIAAVGLIFYPNVTDACTTLLAYEYSSNTSITDATYTGLTTTIGIFPLLTLLGYIAVVFIGMFMGIKLMSNEGSTKFSLGGILLSGIAMIFISLGLNIFPVMLDAISAIVHGGGTGISSAFTGLSSIVLMLPMIGMLSFVTGTVVSGFFGIRLMQNYDD